MKLLDTNVLLHATNASAPQHAVASSSVASAFADAAGVGFAWLALIGFVRLSTRPGILPRPLSAEVAMGVVNHWLAQASAHILQPTAQHPAVLGRLLLGAGSAGNLTNDAHLAAIAIEHGATLVSFDNDFAGFAGLSFERLR